MHLFFDLDGTLTDSCTGITRCVNHALTDLGCETQPEERIRAMIGQPLTLIFGALMPAWDAGQVDRAIASYRGRFDEVGIFENALYPGIAEVLRRLHETGHRLQVVTAKPAVAAARVLAYFSLGGYFEAVQGPALSDRGCDKAALVERALSHAGAGAHEAIMIGDRVDDMLAAQAHGVIAIGAGWGYGSRDELRGAGAACVVDHPSGLPDCIARAHRAAGAADVR
jgi:phosphoglycolate phosphatase